MENARSNMGNTSMTKPALIRQLKPPRTQRPPKTRGLHTAAKGTPGPPKGLGKHQQQHLGIPGPKQPPKSNKRTQVGVAPRQQTANRAQNPFLQSSTQTLWEVKIEKGKGTEKLTVFKFLLWHNRYIWTPRSPI